MLKLLTAGESHGRGVVAILDGFPAGVSVKTDFINKMLRRRQKGYGRGGRMEIEEDRADIISGLRGGVTTGAPILIAVWNKDAREVEPCYVPRPGHADLAGCLKYGFKDTRFISERASARETAARVTAGAICELFLSEFNIEIFSHVVMIGGIFASPFNFSDYKEARKIVESSELSVFDPRAEERMKSVIDEARERGDTVGGIFEVRVSGVPAGLGSHAQWDRKLDGLLAQAVMSIQGIKGVEIGLGFRSAERFGSEVHDPIVVEGEKVKRLSNNAGGVEGGISNGEEIVVRAVMKPISTLKNPLPSVDLRTLESSPALVDRSDICAVPAASVVAEAALAFVLTSLFLERYGGDSLPKIKARYCT